MKDEKSQNQLSLRLGEEMRRKLEEIAETEGNTVQAVIRTFCAEGLKRRAATEAA